MKYISSILIIMLISCQEDDPGLKQLLVNSDMEMGETAPTGWLNYGTGGAFEPEWTNTQSFTPSKSLQIKTSIIYADTFWYWFQILQGRMPTGKDLVLSVRIKGVNLSGDGVSIAIRGDKTLGQNSATEFATTQGTVKIEGTFDWTKYTVRLKSLPPDITVLRVYLIYLGNTTGEVYFDDAKLIVD